MRLFEAMVHVISFLSFAEILASSLLADGTLSEVPSLPNNSHIRKKLCPTSV